MKSRFALLAVILGFAFLAAPVIAFLDHSATTKVGPSLIQGMLDGFGLLWVHLALFVLAFTFVHALAGALSAWALMPTARQLSPQAPGKLALLIYLAGILWMLGLSAAEFPHSYFGSTLHSAATTTWGTALIWVLGLIFLSAIAAGVALLAKTAMQALSGMPMWRASAVTVALIATLATGFGLAVAPAQTAFPAVPGKPHIIVIGIDGWRVDAAPYSKPLRNVMPFVAAFSNNAVQIEEALTPMARTYPAWWTIFSGQFPPSHGVRFNLIPDAHISTPLHLPRQLRQLGYHRILAMDERRFAHFRRAHGFDRIVGPAAGAGDFLIASLHDTPLVNLLVNGPIGSFLFPFLNANRAAYHTYQPASFDSQLAKAISKAPRQPLFLAAHFELPHWPFLWAREPTKKYLDITGDLDRALYYEALEATDTQIRKLFETLDDSDVFQNALVILLSDHGEAFRVDNRTWTNSETGRQFSTPVGHGTHVLGLREYTIPMLIRGYGEQQTKPAKIKGRASLADVYPTIAEWLDIEPQGNPEGLSLVQHLKAGSDSLPSRALPIETGFNPDVFSPEALRPNALLAKGIAHYTVNRDGSLRLKAESLEKLLRQKKRAVIRDNHILSLEAYDSARAEEVWLLADTTNREVRKVTYPSDQGQEIAALRLDYCSHFGLDRYLNFNCDLDPAD